MTEVDKQSKPVGEQLIAKVSINHEDGDSLKFHQQCGRTQQVSGKLAANFNMFLDSRGLKNVPRIKFLPVTFYVYEHYYEPWSVLVEKRLDVNRFRKWNDNKGGVHN